VRLFNGYYHQKIKMGQTVQLFQPQHLSFMTLFFMSLFSCNSSQSDTPKEATVDSAEGNIKMYTNVWDEIINKRKLDKFNDTNFTKNVLMHASLQMLLVLTVQGLIAPTI